jgi:hypothetical protein
VVVVVSAVAPITGSDRDLLLRAGGSADLVVGAVAKIDAHRRWRDVLAADRALLAEPGGRYREMPWVGVAAAPELGAPRVDELVAVLTDGLADPDLPRRNDLRLNNIRVDALRKRRGEIVRSRRAGAPSLRVRVQQARVRLLFDVRTRCAQTLADLREAACEAPRGGVEEFEARVRAASEALVGDIHAEIDRELAAVAADLSLNAHALDDPPRMLDIADPRRRTDRLQMQLTAVLGAGFGIGVALAVSRLIVGALHGSEVAGLAAGGVLGALATLWVIGARALLQDRAALERWAAEVVAALRAKGDELVTSRLLTTEIALGGQLAARDDDRAALIAGIDAELRQLTGLD